MILLANQSNTYQSEMHLVLMKTEPTTDRTAIRQTLAELLKQSKDLEERIEAVLKEDWKRS